MSAAGRANVRGAREARALDHARKYPEEIDPVQALKTRQLFATSDRWCQNGSLYPVMIDDIVPVEQWRRGAATTSKGG